MNIIGKWKVKELLFPTLNGMASYTPENLPVGDHADEIIMLLMSITQFTEDGLMKTLMRVPEDKIEDGFAAIEQTTWKEKDGKFYYDTKVKGEVLGETVDPFAEIPVDENGCLTIAYGTMILERIGDRCAPEE